jgi:hypothetical protein
MNESTHGKCEQCRQPTSLLELFLCKGLIVCQSCFMTETKGNTIFINEDEYPRKKDSKGNMMC